jgi:drug/metabolite transporter (DMT)-like permease
MNNILLLFFALLAAVGNAMFAMGQRKTGDIGSSLAVIALAAAVCLLLTLSVLVLTGKSRLLTIGLTTAPIWVVLSGVGLFFTYLGFNLLYSRFGATSYVYYAVISILTTSLVVGVLILKEPVNIYHRLAGAAAIGAVVLYSIGNRHL